VPKPTGGGITSSQIRIAFGVAGSTKCATSVFWESSPGIGLPPDQACAFRKRGDTKRAGALGTTRQAGSQSEQRCYWLAPRCAGRCGATIAAKLPLHRARPVVLNLPSRGGRSSALHPKTGSDCFGRWHGRQRAPCHRRCGTAAQCARSSSSFSL
jgi:hypothetical protein